MIKTSMKPAKTFMKLHLIKNIYQKKKKIYG